ncbi:hypothetical protein [Brachybacterium alimentarium]
MKGGPTPVGPPFVMPDDRLRWQCPTGERAPMPERARTTCEPGQ